MHWRYSGGYSVSSVCMYSCLPLQLARRGLDVVIMSCSREKLDKVAEEISRSSLCTLVCVYKCMYSETCLLWSPLGHKKLAVIER